MKGFGFFLLAVGAIAFLVGFSMDTSVSTRLGSRVHNIGLINERQNIIIFAGVMTVIGAIFFGLATKHQMTADQNSSTTTCPFCAEKIKAEATICRFCQRELPKSDNYIAQAERADSLKRTQAGDDFATLYTEVSSNFKKHAPFLFGIVAFIIFVAAIIS